MKSPFPALAALMLLSSSALASTTSYDPLLAFAPYRYPQPATAYRSASGKPGPLYWQNRADYRIQATLTPTTRQLSGEEVISYTNHSPDALDVLWLQLDQNRYRRDARGAFTGKFPTEFTGGYTITSVALEDANGKRQPLRWLVSDTRMQVQLPQALKGDGGQPASAHCVELHRAG